MNKKYNVLDLFAGAGGLSLGFELTKLFEIVAAVDNWKLTIYTLKWNKD